MSSISSTTASQLYAPRRSTQDSPQTRMADTISSALSAGTLSSTDATALTSALSSIDSGLSADRANVSSGTEAKLDPSSMKDRVDSLIADQVSSGSLTDDQATELKTLFASHGRSTQTADAADGGVSGAGGPPPGPPPGSPPPDAASGSGTSGSSSSADTSSTNDLLAGFLQQLQNSQSPSVGYGASGSSGSSRISALLVDFRS
ncbi:hypothetical protein MKK63_11580 [Methylobacterium sp. J-088]|uniref:hypothetical protein n=1 Tax=Methylobacterium sp. J-088 TaxID=2836664 RepID=UPI001FBA2319|nr:hypothetical protein [Methylobacterium sp. J-088]MCJ2063349.1 hypothetical protein [Methylobacterium sp. J-088]